MFRVSAVGTKVEQSAVGQREFSHGFSRRSIVAPTYAPALSIYRLVWRGPKRGRDVEKLLYNLCRAGLKEFMTFTDAIKVCFSKYADFNGCASRAEFWWWTLFTVVASVVLQGFSYNLALAFTIVTLLPGTAVLTRRLHDTDRSGYWQLLELIPIIGWIALIVWCAQAGPPNRYGD